MYTIDFSLTCPLNRAHEVRYNENRSTPLTLRLSPEFAQVSLFKNICLRMWIKKVRGIIFLNTHKH